MEPNFTLKDRSHFELADTRPKPKIIKNLPIQKPLNMGIRQNPAKEAIDKIINDPSLAMFVSPAVSKDEPEHKKPSKELIDEGTQMSDRRTLCASNSIMLTASPQTNVSFSKATPDHSLLINESSKSFFDSFLSENSRKSFIYTSPLFKAENLSSNVFKQRLNFRVMKMNSLSFIK